MKTKTKAGSAPKKGTYDNPHIGGSLDDFLEEEGLAEEVEELACKRELARTMIEKMKGAGVDKVKMARKMNTSRTTVDRLLNQNGGAVNLRTIVRAAHVVGHDVEVRLVPRLSITHPQSEQVKHSRKSGKILAGE